MGMKNILLMIDGKCVHLPDEEELMTPTPRPDLENESTPRPWTLDESGIIWGPPERFAGKTEYPQITMGSEMSDADKALIVQAVNSYDAQRAALEELIKASRDLVYGPANAEKRDRGMKAIAKAEAVLK